MYICQLSNEQQAYLKRAISRKLYQLGYKGIEHKEILQNGMDSKLCDRYNGYCEVRWIL